MRRSTLAAVLCLLLGPGFAGSRTAALAGGDLDASAEQARETAAEPDAEVVFEKAHPLADPVAGKAIVYVVRPTSMGFAIKSYFFVDDAIAGINRGSSYFFVVVDPGKHVFWSKSENIDALELTVEADQTYYIQQRVRMGGFRARTKLEVLDPAEGRKALDDCAKHASLTSKGQAKGKEYVVKYKDETKEDLERRARDAKQAEEKR